MINTKDIRAFTKQILNEDDDYENLNDYDVNHLDYRYIEKCSDIKELKKLLKILKSGKEGYFLQMEDAIQKKLEELDPSLKKKPLPKKEDIANELNDWVNMLKKKDNSLKNNNKAIFTNKSSEKILTTEITFNTEEPVENITNKNEKTNTYKNISNYERIKSTDYRKWDLYNVDEEIKKIDYTNEVDKNDKKGSEYCTEKKNKIENYTRRLNKEKHIPAVSDDDIKQRNTEELRALAEIEKNKGNDCYKSKDYEEALIYYTRSLDLLEMPNIYTNRALVNLKLSRFAEAENDATEALRMNDSRFNFKAYLRRGESYSRRARYREAINDFSEALKLEPNNKEAENFLIKAQQNYLEVEGELAEKLDVQIKEVKKQSKSKKKMIIKEVDEIKDEDILLNTKKVLVHNDNVKDNNISNETNIDGNNKNNSIKVITTEKENDENSSNILIENANNTEKFSPKDNNKKQIIEINNINLSNSNNNKKQDILLKNESLNNNELINIAKDRAELISDNSNNNIDKNENTNNNNLNRIINIADINILSEEEDEESSIYNNESDDDDDSTQIYNKMKSNDNKKSKMKSYIDSLKFYNEYDDENEDMNNFNEEEVRQKLEKLNELKQYMKNKFDLLKNYDNDSDIEENDDILILDDEEEEEEEINNNFCIESDNEEINFMEFLKAKEKERRELYEKTMNSDNKNNYFNNDNIRNIEIDNDNFDSIYNSDNDEILNIINNQLKGGSINNDENKYIKMLLKNKRQYDPLGSDNSDFENYDFDSD
ncbi:hypothetical protein BCR36DRAFT_580975 [Piromyces finnis]|uniref:TPR-like protein n=1 Tax=Piromyces finnis TaxID=1754191 RepID=A0A1Y1VI11_9FUNG|nr:hypothetical protein BCR36DRAFT_580975 [Piromyces finnis]|eukprot:ORX56661.1 hypothetical protein BCR36DRAFT_580975 [Piromyces finnis]